MNQIAHRTSIGSAYDERRRAVPAFPVESAWDSPEALAHTCRGILIGVAVSLLIWVMLGLAIYAAVRSLA